MMLRQISLLDPLPAVLSQTRTRSIGLLVSLASLLLAAGCSANTDDLFGDAGGAGGSSSHTSTTSASGTQSTNTVTSGSPTTNVTGTSVSTTSGGPLCGNGTIDAGEQCDGADLGQHSCTELGFANPAGVTCGANCQLDTTGCHNVCGNGTVEPGEQCDDSNTNAYDACSLTCASQGTTCANSIPVALGPTGIEISADTSGTSNFMSTGCQQATGPELVYSVVVTQSGFLTAWTDPAQTNYDALIYARVGNDCATAEEVGCGDNVAQEPDLLSIPVQANEVVYLFVDGFAGNESSGHFDLHMSLAAGTCADPVPILVGDNGVAEHARGNTQGQGADGTGTCGGFGQDVVYAITRLSEGSVDVTTTPISATPYHSVTHARTSCNDQSSEVECDNTQSNTSSINIDDVGTQTPTYVWVDGIMNSAGAYDVSFGP